MLRTFVILGLLAVLAGGAAAQESTTIELEAHDVYFTKAGETAQNPALTVEPGAEVTIALTNVGMQPHNLQIDGIEGAKIECCLANGESGNVTFTAPSEPGTYEYYCLPHKAQGMKGSFVVGTAEASEDDAETTDGASGGDAEETSGTNESPGVPALALLAGLGAVAVLARRR